MSDLSWVCPDCGARATTLDEDSTHQFTTGHAAGVRFGRGRRPAATVPRGAA